jgi:hypothetical protein
VSDDKEKKDNLILFPLNKIKHKDTAGKPKHNEKVHQRIVEEQTREFVEGNVDDIAYQLLDKFVQMGIRTNKMTFTADLALVIDAIRGLIYRDFNKVHPAQILTDKMVTLNVKGKNKTAKLNYNELLGIKHKTHKPISKEVEEELKDLADMGDVQFTQDFNLDEDPNGNGKK